MVCRSRYPFGAGVKVAIDKIGLEGNICNLFTIVNKLPEVTVMTNRTTRMMCYNLARFP